MLGKLFGKSDSKNDEVPPLAPGLASTILGTVGLSAIPVMPNSAQQAFKLSTNPNAELRDFVDVVEADESLSARVLKVANSVYFDRGQPSRSVSDAVGVIGLSELKGLLNAQAVTQLFPSRNKLRLTLWGNSVGTAIAARIIAQNLLPSKADTAFLAGLLHDVGKLLLLQRHADVYEKIGRKVAASGISYLEAEHEVYPFSHQEVGQVIAERWSFSPELIHVIRMHHSDWKELKRGSLTMIVKAADVVAHALALGEGPELSALRENCNSELGAAKENLSISSSAWASVLDSAKRAFESEYELYSSWGR